MERYEVLNLIERGSYGTVYKGRCSGSGKTVALKFLPKEGRSEVEHAALQNEIAILRGLRHPNIIQLLDSFHTDTEICIVTGTPAFKSSLSKSCAEFAHGELSEKLAVDGCFPENVVQSIARQMVSALHYLHQRRIIHRDLKPQSLRVSTNGAVKLCNFGFARCTSGQTVAATSILGTPLYMAPELLQEQPYNHTVDLWSLGVILFELLTGKPPFSSKTMLQRIQAICQTDVEIPETLSEPCRSFLNGLLHKDPRQRLNYSALLKHPFLNPPKEMAVSADNAARHRDETERMATVLEDWRNNGCDKETFIRYRRNGEFVTGFLLCLRELSSQDGLEIPASTIHNLFDCCTEFLMDASFTKQGVSALGSLLLCAANSCLGDEALVQTCGKGSDFRRCLACCGLRLAKDLLRNWIRDQPNLHHVCEQIEPFLRRLPDLLNSSRVSGETREHFKAQIEKLNLLESLYNLRSVCCELGSFSSLLEAYLAVIPIPDRTHGVPFYWSRADRSQVCAIEDRSVLHDVIRLLSNPQAADLIITDLQNGHPAALKVVVAVLLNQPSSLVHRSRQLLPLLLSQVDSEDQYRAICAAVAVMQSLDDPKEFLGIASLIEERLLPLLSSETTSNDIRSATAACLQAFLEAYLRGRLTSTPPETQIDGTPDRRDAVSKEFLSSTLEATATAIRLLNRPNGFEINPQQQLRWQTDPFRLLAVLCQAPDLCLTDIYAAMQKSGALEAARNHILMTASTQPPFSENIVAIVDIFISFHSDLPREPNAQTTTVNREMVQALMQILFNYTQSSPRNSDPLQLKGSVESLETKTEAMLKICSLFHLYCRCPRDPHDHGLRNGLLQAMGDAKGVQILKAVVETMPQQQLNLPIYLLTQLLLSDTAHVHQLRDGGGFGDPFLSKLLSPPCAQFVIETWLCALSHIFKSSAACCEDFKGTCIVPLLKPLLAHASASVRAKACCCLGHLCRYSNLFYSDLHHHDIPALLLTCCQDPDCTTRKFACFAIGNAVFHSDLLHEAFCDAIPMCVRLIQSELDDRTRANAATVLSNLVRHSDHLCSMILQSSAISALLGLIREYLDEEDERDGLKAGWTAIFTLGSFCSYPLLREEILKHNIQALLAQTGCSRNPWVLQYGRRLCNKLESP